LIDAAPRGHRHTTASAGALRIGGSIAPLVPDGAIDGEWSRAYVERVPVPELRRGDAAAMGDLGGHKTAGARRAIEAAGCRVLYPPPYGPDLNPIETAFAKLSGLLREAAERAVDGLWTAIGAPLDRLTRQGGRNDFRPCGYRKNATRS
jgi:transposase